MRAAFPCPERGWLGRAPHLPPLHHHAPPEHNTKLTQHETQHETQQDYRRALHYFRAAAAKGDPEAAAQIGHLHANGLGVPANNETALKCVGNRYISEEFWGGI